MRFVTYLRVSTDKQGKSGLGLEAQQEAVRRYVENAAGVVVGSFIEVESGKRSDRPELLKAMATARAQRATLVIAKLDRLARNVHFISGLMESNVPFVACDNPHANKLTIHLLAAMAEHEAEQISARTKAALAAAKARGVKLGGWRGGKTPDDATRMISAQARAKKAAGFANDLAPLVQQLQAEGAKSLAALADGLNERGVLTPRGCTWTATAVRRVLARAA
jgi:DNA invertase Pin-like site-specific DNA recombinase